MCHLLHFGTSYNDCHSISPSQYLSLSYSIFVSRYFCVSLSHCHILFVCVSLSLHVILSLSLASISPFFVLLFGAWEKILICFFLIIFKAWSRLRRRRLCVTRTRNFWINRSTIESNFLLQILFSYVRGSATRLGSIWKFWVTNFLYKSSR